MVPVGWTNTGDLCKSDEDLERFKGFRAAKGSLVACIWGLLFNERAVQRNKEGGRISMMNMREAKTAQVMEDHTPGLHAQFSQDAPHFNVD